MKIIIQNDVKTKLYEDLMKAGINEIKGACFAYNSSPNVFEIEEVYIYKSCTRNICILKFNNQL